MLLIVNADMAQIRIMPLGDSITWGFGYWPEKSTDEGYRHFLEDSLNSLMSFEWDFVGGESSGDSLTDKDHEGHSGWYANKPCGSGCSGTGIAANVNGWLTANEAHIVLLHIGTNDLILMDAQSVDDTDELVTDVQLIISNIHAFDPDIIIICALIINSSVNANITTLTSSFNTKLNNALTESSTLRIVNMESALSYPADIITDDPNSHSVHPMESGYFKMANVWFQEIKYVIDNILPVELTSFTANAVNNYIELKWNTATEVNNYGFEIHRSSKTLNDDWKKIGFVEGYGNSNSPKSYTYLDNELTAGSEFKYRLKQIDNDGQFEYSKIVEVIIAPSRFELLQNYPNPFNPNTTIEYTIPVESFVELSVFNSLGQNVKMLVNENQTSGNYKVNFSADGLSSGVYYYRIKAGTFTDFKKIILLK
jgi:hypothetical protein